MMRVQATRQKLILLAASLLLVVQSVSSMAQPLHRMGGNSGGGGNLTPAPPMTDRQLEVFLTRSAPVLVRWHLQLVLAITKPAGVETWVFDTDANPANDAIRESIYRKIFKQTETLLAKSRTTKITVQKEPCIDPVTKEKRDASADAENNTICFDMVGIRNAAPNTHLRGKIVSLAVHEFSHLVGTTEEEAKFLERTAAQWISIDGNAYDRVLTRWFNHQNNNPPQSEKLQALVANMDHVEDKELAPYLIWTAEEITQEISAHEAFAHAHGVLPWTEAQQELVVEAKLQATGLRRLGHTLIARTHKTDGGLRQTWLGPWQPLTGDSVAVAPDSFVAAPGWKALPGSPYRVRLLENLPREEWKSEIRELSQILAKLREVEFPEP